MVSPEPSSDNRTGPARRTNPKPSSQLPTWEHLLAYRSPPEGEAELTAPQFHRSPRGKGLQPLPLNDQCGGPLDRQ